MFLLFLFVALVVALGLCLFVSYGWQVVLAVICVIFFYCLGHCHGEKDERKFNPHRPYLR